MSYVHTSSYRVRHYECNAHGTVHHANYLRYMQEAAFDASEAVGYGAARYAEIGYQWLAYETEITYLRPLHYNDHIEVKTWVMDFRRVRSLRRYEVYCAGEQVAVASTDWVLLNAQTNYPASIPQEIIDAYAQGESVSRADSRPAFPRLPDPPPDAFTHDYQVTWRDIDGAQHVNNAIYLYYAEDTARLTGGEHALRHYRIEYKYPAMLDDRITVTTWIGGEGQRYFVITRADDGKLLTRITADNV